MVKTVKTKNQKLLESFKTEKSLNKILLRFSEKTIDWFIETIDWFLFDSKGKGKAFPNHFKIH